MSGTYIGGVKARDKNLANDPDFYKKIGTKGGKLGNTGGFASSKVDKDGLTGRDRARVYGAKGGRLSSRKKIKDEFTDLPISRQRRWQLRNPLKWRKNV
jgi:general stress protein YciG